MGRSLGKAGQSHLHWSEFGKRFIIPGVEGTVNSVNFAKFSLLRPWNWFISSEFFSLSKKIKQRILQSAPPFHLSAYNLDIILNKKCNQTTQTQGHVVEILSNVHLGRAKTHQLHSVNYDVRVLVCPELREADTAGWFSVALSVFYLFLTLVISLATKMPKCHATTSPTILLKEKWDLSFSFWFVF